MNSTSPQNVELVKHAEFARAHLTAEELVRWGTDDDDALEMTTALAEALRSVDSGYIGTAVEGLLRSYYSMDLPGTGYYSRVILGYPF